MFTAVRLPIAADHAAFAGHFPGNPIVPGAVLLDESLYSIAANCGVSVCECMVASVKFLSVARPGESLQLEFELCDVQRVRFAIHVADRVVATGLLSVGAANGRPNAE